jgi:PilZ domain
MESQTGIGNASDTPSSGGKERRRYHRYLCDGFAEVIVLDPECLFRGEIRDVSQTGCFIVSRARIRLAPSAEAEIRFRLNNREFRTQARVMNVRPGDGVGFRFVYSKAGIEAQVRGLIEYLNTKAPDQEA